jgi:hypothetical protein
VVNEVVNQRGIADVGHVELLPSHGRADDREDARADDRPDAKRCQRPRTEGLPERILGFFRVPDQLIDRLAGAKLFKQGRSPRPAIGGNRSIQDTVRSGLSPGPGCLWPSARVRRSKAPPSKFLVFEPLFVPAKSSSREQRTPYEQRPM